LFSISGAARPDANVTPRSDPAYPVSTEPEAADNSPVIAFAVDSNALTTP